MTQDWQKTVNLREQMEKERAAMLGRKEPAKPAQPKEEAAKKPVVQAKARARRQNNNAREIDQVYGDQDEASSGPADLRSITRPVARRVNEPFFKRVVVAAAIIIIGLAAYGMFFHGRGSQEPGGEAAGASQQWYAIKLINDEIYYGQVGDTTADPVVVSNVYYDYDQLKGGSEAEKEGNNLRLVKRGQETYGPAGTMNIVRAQIVYLEPLKEESKVLRAILDYEK